MLISYNVYSTNFQFLIPHLSDLLIIFIFITGSADYGTYQVSTHDTSLSGLSRSESNQKRVPPTNCLTLALHQCPLRPSLSVWTPKLSHNHAHLSSCSAGKPLPYQLSQFYTLLCVFAILTSNPSKTCVLLTF